MNLNKWLLLIVVGLMGLVLLEDAALSQGFKKLEIKDKYGTDTTLPITPKDEDVTRPATPGTAPEGMAYFDGTDLDIREMIKQISALTGKNFIINDKVRGKITIISDKPMTPDEAYQAFLSALEINGFTTVMTPAGLINIIPQRDSNQKPIDLIRIREKTPNTDKYVTRIIQLENTSAKDMATVIKGMVSKNGNMFAYPATNSIIVTDTGSNIRHIMDLIKELDQEGEQQILDMIPIIHADAKDIADKITEIFEKEKEPTVTRRIFRRRPGASQDLEDVEPLSKVVADERTNSIIVLATKRAILKVRELVAKLDRSIAGAEGRIHVYYLKFAKAKEVSEVLTSLVKESAPKTTAKGKTPRKAETPSGSVTLEGGVQVTADEATNSLIIVASAKDYSVLVENVIRKLDILRPQVYLEAVIMSLDVTKTTTLGVSGMGGLMSSLFGAGYKGFGAILPTTPEVISTIAGASGGFGGGIISDKQLDFTLSDGSTTSIPAVSGIIQALASDTDANVLSTPSILTLDNEEAKIQVGQEVPVPSGTTVSSGVTTFDVSREDTGIILKITPQISENNMVRLTIAQEITSVFTTDPNLGPTLDKKSVETVVLARDKQTIVIGGLIDDKNTVTTHKVPFLGDIPVLGNLFRTRTTTRDKTNLIVFITPYIIRERKDYLAVLKKKINERNQFIDMNYGRGQKKAIRRAIKDHAEELLEFKCLWPGDTDPCFGVSYDVYEPVRYKKDDKNGKGTSLEPPQRVRYRSH